MALGEPGDNSAVKLTDFVDRYDSLLADREAKTEDRKGLYQELTKKGLPVKGIKQLIADHNRDQQKLAEKREELRSAGVLLGQKVYVGEVVDDGTDPYADSTVEFAKDKVQAILTLENELAEIAAEMKEVLEEAKATGFVAKLIPQIVKIRRDPDAYHEHTTLMSTYLNALGVAT
jgi:uncharacterized protein (UPF0335 family)